MNTHLDSLETKKDYLLIGRLFSAARVSAALLVLFLHLLPASQAADAESNSKSSSVDQILDSIAAPTVLPAEKLNGNPASKPAAGTGTAAAISSQSAVQQTPALPRETDLENFPFDHNILPLEYQQMLKAPNTDLRKAAAALMERKRKFMMRWEDSSKYSAEDSFPKSLNELELLCIFPDKYLDSVIQKGQLNLHQVGHSRGVCEPAIRAHAEDFMVGIHLENQYDADQTSRLHYLRPKYGYVNFQKPCGIKVNPFRLLQYGTVLIVYNDDVKLRSSYTYGDSLASYCEPWAITMHPLDPIPLTFLRPPGAEESSNCRYVEAQIWGPIELRDIKEFRIPADRKDLVAKLSATGKPIFTYDREKMELNDTFMDIADCGWKRGLPLNELAVELAKKEQVAQK